MRSSLPFTGNIDSTPHTGNIDSTPVMPHTDESRRSRMKRTEESPAPTRREAMGPLADVPQRSEASDAPATPRPPFTAPQPPVQSAITPKKEGPVNRLAKRLRGGG